MTALTEESLKKALEDFLNPPKVPEGKEYVLEYVSSAAWVAEMESLMAKGLSFNEAMWIVKPAFGWNRVVLKDKK